MNKIVLGVEIYDDKTKKKAMKAVSSLSGVESVAMDLNNQKLTLIGVIDPVAVVGKLRKLCRTEVVSVGPAQEKKKKEAEKDEKKKTEVNKKEQSDENVAQVFNSNEPYLYNQLRQPQYYYRSVEEDPNACVIC